MAAARQTSQRLTLLMLVLASITVITLDYRGDASHAVGQVRDGIADVLSPFQRGAAAALHPLGDVVSATFHYGDDQAEIQQLQQEVGALQRQNAGADYVNYAYSQAQFGIAGLPFAPNVPTVLAEVISEPTSNFDEALEIDRGTSSGVGPGMPVVSGSGLIGTVVAPVSSTTARVQLLTSPSESIGVEDTKTGTYVAQGQGPDRPLVIGSTAPSGPPHPGDLLVTSGMDAGAYPPAIPVGKVASVTTNPGGLTRAVQVQPVVNLSALQYVEVLQWLKPA